PTREEIDNTIADIHAGLHQVAQSLPVTTVQTFIGLAGSVTTMSAMAMGLDEYDPHRIHGSHMSLAQVEEVTDRLLRLTRAQRAELGFMHPGRVDVIGGGALVLRESMRVLGLSEVLVSEHDLLDGVVASLTP
ncbi:MAG: exopolyphosphatase, partial [Candidatus Nanopelagicales bacterium]|nr:exopolyphosphatase [Candidatus Nanopelagicales bacterium]